MPRSIKAVGVDITSAGTQVIVFDITRNDDGTFTAEVDKRQPIKRNENTAARTDTAAKEEGATS